MEDSVKTLVTLDPEMAAVVAISHDKGVATAGYYNCGIEEKGMMILHILEDIIVEFIQNNAERIRSIILDEEIDEGDDEDG